LVFFPFETGVLRLSPGLLPPERTVLHRTQKNGLHLFPFFFLRLSSNETLVVPTGVSFFFFGALRIPAECSDVSFITNTDIHLARVSFSTGVNVKLERDHGVSGSLKLRLFPHAAKAESTMLPYGRLMCFREKDPVSEPSDGRTPAYDSLVCLPLFLFSLPPPSRCSPLRNGRNVAGDAMQQNTACCLGLMACRP